MSADLYTDVIVASMHLTLDRLYHERHPEDPGGEPSVEMGEERLLAACRALVVANASTSDEMAASLNRLIKGRGGEGPVSHDILTKAQKRFPQMFDKPQYFTGVNEVPVGEIPLYDDRSHIKPGE